MKTYQEIADSIFERRDKYIAEKRKRKMNILRISCTLCCVLCLVVIGGYYSNFMPDNGVIGKNNQNEQEKTPNNQAHLEGLQNSETSNGQNQNETVDSTDEENNDVYMEHPKLKNMSEQLLAIFCGSYVDENGAFIVLLTDNTTENRGLVCKELGISENNTVFKTETYTFKYLTELQAKISNKMNNKEFPFVISSGVYEDMNCIKVKVTTTDESKLKKLYDLDTIGGAIKVEYVTKEATFN